MSERRFSRQIAEGLEYLQGIGFPEVYAANLSPCGEVGGSSETAAEVAARRTQLEDLANESSACTLCPLSDARQRVVFGSGDANADLMFIGEGPGAEEDRQGLPFVGPAGELLTKIIESIGSSRDRVYIANVVKCRPPGNRDPRPEEAEACKRFLDKQIELVKPRIIVALGRVAAQSLLDTNLSLGRLRGRWHRVAGVPTRVTYHPAALLRNASWKRPTWEDMQEVRDSLKSGAIG